MLNHDQFALFAATLLTVKRMKINIVLSFFLIFALSKNSNSQDKDDAKKSANAKRIGIARIQIFASPAKGTPIADIANLPLFFGSNSDFIKYKKRSFNSQLPPTTGDTIREITSDIIAVYFQQDLWSMSGYGDAGGNSRGKRNMIHDLPTENPQKVAVDSIFDEAIDIGCFWTFVETPDKMAFIPSILMKMEVYDRTGQARPEIVATLSPQEIQTKHFKDSYGVEYDFVKGIPLQVLEDGGIMGNVIADVYLQALNKLLAKR